MDDQQQDHPDGLDDQERFSVYTIWLYPDELAHQQLKEFGHPYPCSAELLHREIERHEQEQETRSEDRP